MIDLSEDGPDDIFFLLNFFIHMGNASECIVPNELTRLKIIKTKQREGIERFARHVFPASLRTPFEEHGIYSV